MQTHEEFLPAFRKSAAYIKLLEELDLLQQNMGEEDNISLNSNDSLEINTIDSKEEPPQNVPTLKFTHSDSYITETNESKNIKHVRSFSDVSCFTAKTEMKVCNNENGKVNSLSLDVQKNEQVISEAELKKGSFTLSANVIKTGKCDMSLSSFFNI